MDIDYGNLAIVFAVVLAAILYNVLTKKTKHQIPNNTALAEYPVYIQPHAALIVAPFRGGKSCIAHAHAQILANADYNVLYVGPQPFCESLIAASPKAKAMTLGQAVSKWARADTIILDVGFQVRDGQLYSYTPVSADTQQWLNAIPSTTRMVVTCDDVYTQQVYIQQN